MYDFFVKLLGAGISSIIFFLPVKVNYQDNIIAIETQLNNPVTEEIGRLVESGFVFGLEYYVSIIVNDSITFNQKTIKQLSFRNEKWCINDSVIAFDQIQQKLGDLAVSFPGIYLNQDDCILIFVKATILPDSEFKNSVGLSTRILWNHYVPKQKRIIYYKEGELIPE